MKDIHKLSDESKVVHAGMIEDAYLSVIPPIYQTSTFKFHNAAHGARLFANEEEGFIYTRLGNPTIKALEDCIAALEQGYGGLACASGMAAVDTVFTTLVKNGDHVICSDSVYGPTTTILATIFSKFGVETTFIDTSDLRNIEKSFRNNTKIVYIETPGNPTMNITDIATAAKLAHSHRCKLIVDNTFMSPVLQKPLTLGADVVLHSLTKFLNGHADVVGGVIIAKEKDDFELLKKTLILLGGIISPFNAFLVHRGIKTLALRMNKHTENAQKIAEYLENHPKVQWVRYPGLKSHPQYELGLKQTSAPGGMISFELKGGVEAGRTVMDNVHLCVLAVSLGGVETLIEHPASMTHASMDKDIRLQAKITDGLVRLSVGIENADELIADLDQAFEKIK
ncbi:MAG: PLP-dependent aspartate aminotransferase family protein [Ignavibacteria bacterium]